MNKITQTVLTFLLLLGMALSAMTYFAKASDLSELINIITRKELREELSTVNDRIWGYEQIELVRGLDREEQKTLNELHIDRCITISDLGIKDRTCE